DGYLLFKELWVLDTPDEHQAAALLLRRFQRTIQEQAAMQGWKVDNTADLARVLRPAGTLNHKSGTPKLVTILHEDVTRYNPGNIEDAPWLAVIEDTYTIPLPQDGSPTRARLDLIVQGCAWMRHCRDEAPTLPEPEWYAMLGIVGRCDNGEQSAHAWSQSYPRYGQQETAKKLQHALAASGPRTCDTIRFDLGGEAYCRACLHWNRIKSPITLGIPVAWGEQGPGAVDSSPAPDEGEPWSDAPVPDEDEPWPDAPAQGKGTQVQDKDPYSDLYNAKLLVELHGRDLHYCKERGGWLAWNGRYWERDSESGAVNFAKATARRMVSDARQWMDRINAEREA